MDVTSLVWRMNGKWATQRAQCGRVKAKLGSKTSVCLPMDLVKGIVCNDALRVIGLYGPSGKISLFLQDWELAKVALSCHMSLDMLYQEMNGPW